MSKNNVNQLSLNDFFNHSYLESDISFIVNKENIVEFPKMLENLLHEIGQLNSNHQQFSISPHQYANALNQLEEYYKEFRSSSMILKNSLDTQIQTLIAETPKLIFQFSKSLFENFLLHPDLKKMHKSFLENLSSTDCVENTFYKFQTLSQDVKKISESQECIYFKSVINLISKVQNHSNLSLYENSLYLLLQDACILDNNFLLANTEEVLDTLAPAQTLNPTWFESILYHFLLLSPSDNPEKSIASFYLSEEEMTNLYLKISNVTPIKIIQLREYQSTIMENKINTLLKNALINSDDNISQCIGYLNFSISFNLDIIGHFKALSPNQQVSYANKYFGAIGNIFESHFLKKHQLINILDIAATNNFSKHLNLSYKEIVNSLITLEKDGSALLACMDRKPISSRHLFHHIFNSLIPCFLVHDNKMQVVNSYSPNLINGYEEDYKNSFFILATHIDKLSEREQKQFFKKWDYSIDKLIERGSKNILDAKYMQVSLTEALCKVELDNLRNESTIEPTINKPKLKF